MININESELFNLAQVGMVILSSDRVVLHANSEAKELFGRNREITGLHIDELFSTESSVDIDACYENVLTEQVESSHYVLRLKTQEKESKWGIVSFVLLGGSRSGKHMLCQIKNISELKEARDQVNYQGHLLMELINNIPDSIFIKDTESRFILANVAVSKLMGVNSPQELVGRTDFDFHPKKLAAKYRRDEVEIITSGEAKMNIIEQVLDPKHNRRWYSTSKIPLRDNDGKIVGIMGVGREISQWIKKQKALRKAKHEAEKADQLKAAFLANISHEVRTPLNGILGFSQFLRQMIEPGTKGHQYIDFIIQNGKSLLHLITDIIDISKIDAGQLIINKKYFVLNEPMRQLEYSIGELLKQNGKENITLHLELELEDNDCVIYGDDLRLKQILHNLLLNAVKFTERGSITFGYHVGKNGISFYVKDTGIGIAPENLGLIFEHFTQVDYSLSRQYGGTGVGLSIVRGLVNLLGGQIGVKSEVSKGSEFCFTLPINGKLGKKIGGKRLDIIPSVNPQVLIFGGNAAIYNIFDETALKEKVHTKYVIDISGLLRYLKSDDRLPDLILCYPESSRASTPNLINKIKDILPQVPILVIVNDTRNLLMEECIAAGAKDIISEPINTTQLVEKIKSLVGI